MMQQPRAGPASVRVLIINDHLGFSGGEIHGVTRWMGQVVPRLQEHGIDASVCILRGQHPGARELEAIGIQPLILARSKWDPRAFVDVCRLVRTRNIDVLHLMGEKGMAIGRMAAAVTDRPAIIHFHDMIQPSRILRAVHRRLVRWTKKALANSPATASFAMTQYALPAEIVVTMPNALDVGHFSDVAPEARSRLRLELGIAADARVVGVLGRLARVKGQDVLIRAFPQVLQDCPDAYLIVIGTGPDEDEYRTLATELRIAERVIFTGHRTDVPELLSALDVVAVPSMWDEAFGFTALEAIAAGKPVVASESGGLSLTVLEGVTGFLVPRGNPEALAGALRGVLLDEELRDQLGDGAVRHARTFGIDKYVRDLVAVYRSVAEID